MPLYIVERHLGAGTDVNRAGSRLKQVANEQFPDIVWEHSHAVETEHGLVLYCLYEASCAQPIRDHAAAAGLPCHRISKTTTLGPADFDGAPTTGTATTPNSRISHGRVTASP